MEQENKQFPVLSEDLIALLRFVKKNNIGEDFTWETLRQVFGPIYSDDMKFYDIYTITLRTYFNALNIKKFMLGDIASQAINMTKETLTRIVHERISSGKINKDWKDIEHRVEEFYNDILRYVVTDLRVNARKDWCADQLKLDCNINTALSCVCNRGTKSCNIYHEE